MGCNNSSSLCVRGTSGIDVEIIHGILHVAAVIPRASGGVKQFSEEGVGLRIRSAAGIEWRARPDRYIPVVRVAPDAPTGVACGRTVNAFQSLDTGVGVFLSEKDGLRWDPSGQTYKMYVRMVPQTAFENARDGALVATAEGIAFQEPYRQQLGLSGSDLISVQQIPQDNGGILFDINLTPAGLASLKPNATDRQIFGGKAALDATPAELAGKGDAPEGTSGAAGSFNDELGKKKSGSAGVPAPAVVIGSGSSGLGSPGQAGSGSNGFPGSSTSTSNNSPEAVQQRRDERRIGL